jgi:hypothetical protein
VAVCEHDYKHFRLHKNRDSYITGQVLKKSLAIELVGKLTKPFYLVGNTQSS